MTGASRSRRRLPFSRISLFTLPVLSPCPQLTVYLGKRDFVDHLTCVDPVGESKILLASITLSNIVPSASVPCLFCGGVLGHLSKVCIM